MAKHEYNINNHLILNQIGGGNQPLPNVIVGTRNRFFYSTDGSIEAYFGPYGAAFFIVITN